MMSIRELCRACREDDRDTVKKIVEEGNIDTNALYLGCSPLHNATYNNHPHIVRLLLSTTHTRLDATDSYGWTGLHYACYYNSAEVISVLGGDQRCNTAVLNMKDITGKSALMVAVGRNNLDCVKEMARLDGTDFDTKNRGGMTPEEVAKNYNFARIFDFLTKRKFADSLEVETDTSGSDEPDMGEHIEVICEMHDECSEENKRDRAMTGGTFETVMDPFEKLQM